MVGGADVDVGEGTGRFEELVGDAEVRDRFPDEERTGECVWGLYLLSKGENRCDKFDAARWRRDNVIGFGLQERRGECVLIKAEVRSCVMKSSVF